MDDHTFAVWLAGPLTALKAREARRADRLNMLKRTTALAQHLRQSTACRRARLWRGGIAGLRDEAKGKSTFVSPEKEAPVQVTFPLACMLHLPAPDWSICLPNGEICASGGSSRVLSRLQGCYGKSTSKHSRVGPCSIEQVIQTVVVANYGMGMLRIETHSFNLCSDQ
jgi:hypothetical protein